MTGDLRLRVLSGQDLPALRDLLETDPGYARRVTGHDPRPGDAEELLTVGPPGLPAERKVVLGAVDDDGLACVVDLLRGWPDPATAYIGLLQVHAARQRQGMGRRTHELLLDLVSGWPEVTRLRAVVVGTNAQEAEPFWSALGYRPTETPKPFTAGSVVTTATGWTRAVRPAGPPREHRSR
jgi:GNAT superfamily N-acetyltransferase